MQIVRGVRRQGLPKIIAAEGTNFNNLTRKSVAVSAPLKRTLHFFFETVRFRHDSVQDASHFPVLQFDSKQILRLIVYNENIEQILPREKIFRDLFSNYGKELSIGKKTWGFTHQVQNLSFISLCFSNTGSPREQGKTEARILKLEAARTTGWIG